MKKILVLFAVVLMATAAHAQKLLAYPYQGGQSVMNDFFLNNFVPSAEMKQQYAAGVVTLKFTADQKGNIKKIVVYYADDLVLAQPVADLIQKTNRKWIVPEDGEKQHDFIITFAIGFTQNTEASTKAYGKFFAGKGQLLTNNQVPLDEATLLPTVVLRYDPAQ